jgi:hypothetical protein
MEETAKKSFQFKFQTHKKNRNIEIKANEHQKEAADNSESCANGRNGEACFRKKKREKIKRKSEKDIKINSKSTRER